MSDLEPIEPGVIDTSQPIHDFFSLSYANHLVIPRSVLQSMPKPWQAAFVKLIEEMNEKLSKHGIEIPETHVRPAGDTRDRFMHRWLLDYERGRRNVFTEGQVRVE